jgi:uncharacterized protein YyaL (SSP411 family)
VLPVDGKVLAGWNGLALSAFVAGAAAFGDTGYRETADGIRDYIVGELWRDGRLARARAGGVSLGSPSIEDYAYVVRGLVEYAEFTRSDEDLELARDMLVAAFERFRVDNGWRMSEESLIAPQAPRELVTDSPMPSPAAVLAAAALSIGQATQDRFLLRGAHDALNRAYQSLAANAFFHATHIRALSRLAAN